MNLEAFRAALGAIGVPIDDAALEKLGKLRALLEEGSRRASLVARSDEATFLEVHALDSLTVSRALAGEEHPSSILDVGSGAGFPAIPIAIAWSSAEVTALESNAKKCRFLRGAAAALGLEPRFRVVEGRAEEAGRDPGLRDRFDLVVARAVAALPVLCELALPFVRPGGIFVAWKGAKAESGEVESALPAIRELASELSGIVPSGVPGRDLVLVKVRKLASTPPRYPRRTGIPEKRPLCG